MRGSPAAMRLPAAANKVMLTKIDPRRFNARGSEIY
jgi:hypothetical protein